MFQFYPENPSQVLARIPTHTLLTWCRLLVAGNGIQSCFVELDVILPISLTSIGVHATLDVNRAVCDLFACIM